MSKSGIEAITHRTKNCLPTRFRKIRHIIVDKVFLHPGDSIAESLSERKNTPILALPLMAPRETELQTFEFAKKMSPQKIVPIHDGFRQRLFSRIALSKFYEISET